MSTTAKSTRHLATIWRGEKPWHWTTLMYGHVQPLGYRNHFRRFFWQLHFTPVHMERDGNKWEIGVCFGKRTLFVKVHR
jgi:hypothetical protein